VLSMQGKHEPALELIEQSMAQPRELAAEFSHAFGHTMKALILGRMGRHEEALGSARQALEIHSRHGYVYGHAVARDVIGLQYKAIGDATQAIAEHRLALAVFIERQMWSEQTASLNYLGAALLAAGSPAGARECHHRAVEMATTSCDRYQCALGLRGIADVMR